MIRRWLLPLALLAVTASPGLAQFAILGENKVQYRHFDWEVLKGPHIDLYFYPEEADLAPTALEYAEESYEVLRLKFSHEVTSRIPLIVYASHSDFEQTNILPFTPPGGLARGYRLPEAAGNIAVPRQSGRVPPHDAPRAGPRIPDQPRDRSL